MGSNPGPLAPEAKHLTTTLITISIRVSWYRVVTRMHSFISVSKRFQLSHVIKDSIFDKCFNHMMAFQELIQDLHNLHEEWLVQQKYYQPPAPVLVSYHAMFSLCTLLNLSQ